MDNSFLTYTAGKRVLRIRIRIPLVPYHFADTVIRIRDFPCGNGSSSGIDLITVEYLAVTPMRCAYTYEGTATPPGNSCTGTATPKRTRSEKAYPDPDPNRNGLYLNPILDISRAIRS